MYKKPKVIAEIGCNHKGDMGIAFELLDLAKSCFDFLPTRAKLDLSGWLETDIFAH